MNKDKKYSLVLEKCDLCNSGEYKAVLKNSFGEVHSKMRLNVLPNPNQLNESPCFVEQLKDINVNEGQDVCFKCKVTGIPQPDVVWFKDGNPIQESSNIKVGLN